MGRGTLHFEPWARMGNGACGTRFLLQHGFWKAQLLVRCACCSPWVLVRPGPCAPRYLLLVVGRGLWWPRALPLATGFSSCCYFASANVALELAPRSRRSLREGPNVVQHGSRSSRFGGRGPDTFKMRASQGTKQATEARPAGCYHGCYLVKKKWSSVLAQRIVRRIVRVCQQTLEAHFMSPSTSPFPG